MSFPYFGLYPTTPSSAPLTPLKLSPALCNRPPRHAWKQRTCSRSVRFRRWRDCFIDSVCAQTAVPGVDDVASGNRIIGMGPGSPAVLPLSRPFPIADDIVTPPLSHPLSLSFSDCDLSSWSLSQTFLRRRRLGTMEAIRKQASKLREQVAKQQQVRASSLTSSPFYFRRFLINWNR